MPTVADSLITDATLQVEVAARIANDVKIVGFSGQPTSSDLPTSAPPAYTSVGAGTPHTATTDITQGSSLLAAISSLALNKNTKLVVYNADGTTSQGNNPTGIYMTQTAASATSLLLTAGKLVLNISMKSTEEFVSDATLTYRTITNIGASITVLSGISLTKKKVTLF